MGKIAGYNRLVESCLRRWPATRDCDALLYSKVCEALNPQSVTMPMGYVMSRLGSMGLPPMETIRRARQKMQADNPELRATPETRAKRSELEGEYRAYALE